MPATEDVQTPNIEDGYDSTSSGGMHLDAVHDLLRSLDDEAASYEQSLGDYARDALARARARHHSDLCKHSS